MFSRLHDFMKANGGSLIGGLTGSLLLVIVVLYPRITELVAVGLALTPYVYQLVESVPYLLQGAVAMLLATAVMLLFYLLRTKHSLLVSGVGLSLGYVLLSWLDRILNLSVYEKAAIYFFGVFVLFYGLMQINRSLKLHSAISSVIFIIMILSSVYVVQIIDQAFDKREAAVFRQAAEAAQDREFEAVREGISYPVYYPTYSSEILPASVSTLNGYSAAHKKYTNPHIAFTIGGAQVTQAGLLKNQEKVMDFTRNCDISLVARRMDRRVEITQTEVDASLKNLSRCKVVHQTPAGADVYFRSLGQGAIFYLQQNGTNIVIEFNGSRKGKYSDTLLPEIKKVIDSMQPIANDKLQRGDMVRANKY
jgi:hypothetical protein